MKYILLNGPKEVFISSKLILQVADPIRSFRVSHYCVSHLILVNHIMMLRACVDLCSRSRPTIAREKESSQWIASLLEVILGLLTLAAAVYKGCPLQTR